MLLLHGFYYFIVPRYAPVQLNALWCYRSSSHIQVLVVTVSVMLNLDVVEVYVVSVVAVFVLPVSHIGGRADKA